MTGAVGECRLVLGLLEGGGWWQEGREELEGVRLEQSSLSGVRRLAGRSTGGGSSEE